ncbi:MAG: hypothetical protein LL056_09675 [Bifidobacterium breve]|nr:hypothetical protein [Bifidobacterium breve]
MGLSTRSQLQRTGQGWYRKHDFDQSIVVPFCPESKLSGIEYKDFIHCCWYRRSIELSEKELAGIVRLHFGAVDYETTVYLNGERLGVHRGGYSPFSFDIQRIAHVGVNELVVCVKDELRSGRQPRGKQSERYDSYGCCYTRTTGIWQTVWLEFMPQTHVVSARFHPNLSRDSVGIDLTVNGRTRQRSQLANITISFEGNQVALRPSPWAVTDAPWRCHLRKLSHGPSDRATYTMCESATAKTSSAVTSACDP